MAVTLRKGWPETEPLCDRRRSKRFNVADVPASVALVEVGKRGLRLIPCTLHDLSYGGMCMSTEWPLEVDQTYSFLLQLDAPFSELVLTKARVLWMGKGSNGRERFGTGFLESSKGWLGPDEDPVVS